MSGRGWTEDQGDYDDGTPDSGRSQDWDMEPGDPGWLGPDPMEEDDDD
ncbi:hypothetical protein [Photobacterium sp. OFAV2-7]|nr:hypothetical protein [Photobacterium sp. OFAV2-7]MCG7584953.1 hypothetical protein [Photobacterium sp. OFAV2-7]